MPSLFRIRLNLRFQMRYHENHSQKISTYAAHISSPIHCLKEIFYFPLVIYLIQIEIKLLLESYLVFAVLNWQKSKLLCIVETQKSIKGREVTWYFASCLAQRSDLNSEFLSRADRVGKLLLQFNCHSLHWWRQMIRKSTTVLAHWTTTLIMFRKKPFF